MSSIFPFFFNFYFNRKCEINLTGVKDVFVQPPFRVCEGVQFL